METEKLIDLCVKNDEYYDYFLVFSMERFCYVCSKHNLNSNEANEVVKIVVGDMSVTNEEKDRISSMTNNIETILNDKKYLLFTLYASVITMNMSLNDVLELLLKMTRIRKQ